MANEVSRGLQLSPCEERRHLRPTFIPQPKHLNKVILDSIFKLSQHCLFFDEMAVENTGLDLSNRLRRNKETANKCKKTKRSGLCFKKDNCSFGPMFMCFIITKEEVDALAVVVETLASPCFLSLCSCTCLERQHGWARWQTHRDDEPHHDTGKKV